jgi:hypothetical protein
MRRPCFAGPQGGNKVFLDSRTPPDPDGDRNLPFGVLRFQVIHRHGHSYYSAMVISLATSFRVIDSVLDNHAGQRALCGSHSSLCPRRKRVKAFSYSV